jgi:hypothetical protein
LGKYWQKNVASFLVAFQPCAKHRVTARGLRYHSTQDRTLRICGLRILTDLNLLALTACNNCGGSIDGAEHWISKHMPKAFMREQYGRSAVLAVKNTMEGHGRVNYTRSLIQPFRWNTIVALQYSAFRRSRGLKQFAHAPHMDRRSLPCASPEVR